MTTLAALGLSLLGTVGGVLTASAVLLARERVRDRLLPALLSYAVGTLLGAALLGLLPEALETLRPRAVLGTLIAGVLAFFVLEKSVLLRHCHDTADCRLHSSAAPLVLVGDALHAFADGAVIAAAVSLSLPLGLSTAIAVAAHEIPQEVGDFAILLGAGYSRRRAFGVNLVSAGGALAGAGAVLLSAHQMPGVLPWVLAFAAGNFLYIAMADLIPTLHRGALEASPLRQVLLIGAGVVSVGLF